MKDLYSQDVSKVSAFLDELTQDEQNYKQTLGRQAKKYVAFANGDQNPSPIGSPIMVNNQPVNYTQSDSRLNMYQTNEIEPIIRTIISYMTRSKPGADISAESKDDDSKRQAKVAERVMDAKYDLDNEYQNSKDAAFWALTTGTVFAKDYWDYTQGSYTDKVDEAGNVITDPMTGDPILDQQKTGNNSTVMLTFLSVALDHSVLKFEDQPYIGDDYIMDVEWAREAFDQDLPGYTGQALLIEEDGYSADTISLLEDMKYAIPYVSGGMGSRPKSKGKCLVRERYIRPNKQFPRGRLIIKAGNKVVFASGPKEGSPYWAEAEREMWHPYSCFRYAPYVGRFLGKSLVEQLFPLQMRLNEINGSILENANTLAKPNIMAKVGQLKKGVLNGRGANIYTYADTPGNQQAPFILPGAPLPAQFFNEKQSIIDQMVRIAGTNFVMQGQPPTGVTAASAIQQLLENANNQHSDMMNSWEKFHEQRYTKKLRIIHKFHNYPDKNLDSYIKTLAKDVLDEDIQSFVGAKDFSDGITLKIQAGSMIPKSESVKKEIYQGLAKEGLLGPIAEDSPRGMRLRDQLLEKLGEAPLETEESIELKKAKWENDKLLRGIYIQVSPYDNPSIHLPCHIEKIQDPSFLETATPEQYSILTQHIQEHEAIEKQKAMAAQEEAQAQMESQRSMAIEDEVTKAAIKQNSHGGGAIGPPALMQ